MAPRWKIRPFWLILVALVVPALTVYPVGADIPHPSPSGNEIQDRLLIEIPKPSQASARSWLVANGATIDVELPLVDYWVVSVPPGKGHAWHESVMHQSFASNVYHDEYFHLDSVPNDPRYSSQWGPPAIQADLAWDQTSVGQHPVMIAIIDSGVQANHPDLNGAVCHLGPDYVEGDMVPQDTLGHGTHVAGIAAAHRDNGVGVAGIAPACIMAIRVIEGCCVPLQEIVGAVSNLMQGILYATINGADVINLSLGGIATPPVCSTIDAAALLNVVVVAAAGNNGPDPDVFFPAACAGAIGVASLDSPNTVSSFSSRGPHVEIAAPGGSIVSTFTGSGYATLSGTSMAAPHVAGTAALVLSADPLLTAIQVRCILNLSADEISGTTPLDVGFGRVNALDTVKNRIFQVDDPACGMVFV